MIRSGNKTPYRIAPGLLDRNWSEFMGGRDLKNETFQPLGVARPISGGTIVEGLAPIIQKILDALAPLQAMAADGAWSKDMSLGQGLGILTEQLEKGVFPGIAAGVENLDEAYKPSLVETYQKMAGRNLSSAEWLPLFDFAGWSTVYSVGDMPSGWMSPTRVGDMPSK
jgi:hypothetical protein